MHKLTRLRALSLVTAAVAIAVSLINSEAPRVSASGATQQPVRVETYVPQGAPLTFGRASLMKEDGRTVLAYSIINSGAARLNSVELVALVLDAAGDVRAGQGWRVNVATASRETIEGRVALEREVRPTDYVLLTVSKASGGAVNFTRGFSRTWKDYRRSKGMAVK